MVRHVYACMCIPTLHTYCWFSGTTGTAVAPSVGSLLLVALLSLRSSVSLDRGQLSLVGYPVINTNIHSFYSKLIEIHMNKTIINRKVNNVIVNRQVNILL